MIHEFGHFIAAKLFGVGVERFSVGMGKVIWARVWGGTEYCLSALPIGGYVKLTGPMSQELMAYDDALTARERLEAVQKKIEALRAKDGQPDDALRNELREAETAAGKAKARYESVGGQAAAEKVLPGVTGLKHEDAETASWLMEDNIALRNKPFYAKFIIFVAGCVMNFLLAWLVLVAMYVNGVMVDLPPTTAVERPRAESPLSPYDIQDGDMIVSANGKAVATWQEWEDVMVAAERAREGVTLELKRAGTERLVSLTIPYIKPGTPTGNVVPDSPEASQKHAREFYSGSPYRYFSAYQPIMAGEVLANQPAERGGIRRLDKIVAINGVPANTWRDLQMAVEPSPGVPLTFEIERLVATAEGVEPSRFTYQITPNDDARIGIMPGYDYWVRKQWSVRDAAPKAAEDVVIQAVLIIDGFKKLLTGAFRNPLSQLGGPLSIGVLTYKKAQEGGQRYFMWFALINIVLAVMNLLPIPLLDGGHIMFAFWESLTRRPFPARPLLIIYQASFYFIMCLAVFLLGNDLVQNAWRVTGGGKPTTVEVAPQTPGAEKQLEVEVPVGTQELPPQ